MASVKQMTDRSTEGDFPYFRSLWNSMVVALLSAAFVPLIFIGGGMYYYAATALKDNTLASLCREAGHLQKSVDQFLTERIKDLREVCETRTLASLEQPGELKAILKAMQPVSGSGYFTDLGVFDQNGTHRAYEGPYDLRYKNYRDAPWFKTVMALGAYVSDVFTGFRQEPHFIIAIRQQQDGIPWVIRATINSAYFDSLVSNVPNGNRSYLINAKGFYQTNPAHSGQAMGPSGIIAAKRFDGIRYEEGGEIIRVMTWLKQVPWLSVVEVRQAEIFKLLRRVRHVGIFVFILGAVIISFTVLLSANHLVGRLEIKRKNLQLMGHHLRQANKMTLSLQLYKGFFQEINDALVNIDSSAEWVADQVRIAPGLQACREEVDENLEQIRNEIARSRKTIHQLISFSLPAAPVVTDVDINKLLDRLGDFFQRELHYNNIQIQKDYQESLPTLRSDPSQLQQVFQNLVFNAIDAIEKDGVISLKTFVKGDEVGISVADSGPGIASQIIERIFEPLFTTNYRRLGLGLAICRDILKQMGGRIEVASGLGKGATFTVMLPLTFKPGRTLDKQAGER